MKPPLSQVGAYILVVALAIAGSIVATHNADQIAQQQQDLQQGLIRNCQKNGNPLRAVVRTGVREDLAADQKKLHQTIHANFAKFFPTVPAARLAQLKQNAIDDTKKDLRRKRIELGASHPVDCVALYK